MILKNILNTILSWIKYPIKDTKLIEVVDEKPYEHRLRYNAKFQPNNGASAIGWGSITPSEHILSWCHLNNIIYNIDEHIIFNTDTDNLSYQHTFTFKNKEDAIMCKLIHGED